MEQRDSALERLLHRRRAGNGKMNRAQLGLGEVFVVMVVFVFLVVGKRELTQAQQQEQTCDFLHRDLPRGGDTNSSHARNQGQTALDPEQVSSGLLGFPMRY